MLSNESSTCIHNISTNQNQPLRPVDNSELLTIFIMLDDARKQKYLLE